MHGRSRIHAMRGRSQGRRVGRGRLRSHRALRIQQPVVARPQTQADQSARVRHFLRLPAVIGLITPHGIFAGLVPRARRFAGQIMLAYQRFLNRLRPLRFNLLLAPCGLPFTALPRTRVLRFAVGTCRRTGFWMFAGGRVRCGMRLGSCRGARSSALRPSRRVCLRTRRLRVRRRGLRAAGLRIGGRRLPHRRGRSADTHQSQSANCAHRPKHSCAMRRFQRQPSEKMISGRCSSRQGSVTSGQQNPLHDSAASADH
jgi:hypothetical protein